MEIRPSTWNFVAQMDATPMDLEPFVVREALDLRSHLPADVRATIGLRRAGRSLRGQRWLGRLELAAAPLGLALAAGVTVALGFNPVGAVAAAAAVGWGVWRDGRKRLAANRLELHHEPAWSGTRTFVTQGEPTSQATVAPPDPGQLAQQLSWPSRFRVLLVTGRREGDRLGGMPASDIAQALALVHQRTGQKTDLVVLEGCHSADLAWLSPLAAHARYALVSQETLWAPGLPWPYVLDRRPPDPESLGKALVQAAGGLPGVPTLSLIDLERLPALEVALASLPPDSRPGPQDLGGFLAGLEPSPAVDRGREALARAVVLKKARPDLDGQASGLSR